MKLARGRYGWALAAAGAVVLVFLVLYASPKWANRREHRPLESAASHVDLSRSCERTGLVREGSVYRMFGKPPFITVTYWCSGLTHDEVREIVDAALRRGGFGATSKWSDANYGQSGRLEVSTWVGHASQLYARISTGEVELELERPPSRR